MKYCDGDEMKTGDIGYFQPGYISGGTPHCLVFIGTTNGSPRDPSGRFRHKHTVDNPPTRHEPSYVSHWSGTVAKTPQEAIALRAKQLRDLADKMEGRTPCRT